MLNARMALASSRRFDTACSGFTDIGDPSVNKSSDPCYLAHTAPDGPDRTKFGQSSNKKPLAPGHPFSPRDYQLVIASNNLRPLVPAVVVTHPHLFSLTACAAAIGVLSIGKFKRPLPTGKPHRAQAWPTTDSRGTALVYHVGGTRQRISTQNTNGWARLEQPLACTINPYTCSLHRQPVARDWCQHEQ